MFLRRKLKTSKVAQIESQLTIVNPPPPPSPVATSQFLTHEDLNNVIETVRNRFNLDRFNRDYTSVILSNQQLRLKQEAQRKIMLAITIILIINQMIMLSVVAMH